MQIADNLERALNKNVELILGKKIENKFVSFIDQYDAFCKEIKITNRIQLLVLTTDLRKMKTRVLHDGYNHLPMKAN